MPYELGPEFLAELFTKHAIDYVVHGDDPCLLPDGSDAYAYAKKQACPIPAAHSCGLIAYLGKRASWVRSAAEALRRSRDMQSPAIRRS